MNNWEKWEDSNLEKVKITIEIPKHTIAFVVNTISKHNGVLSMTNLQYGAEDTKKLIKDSGVK